MERASRDQDFADLYRTMSRRGRWRGIGSSRYGDEHTGGVPLLRLSIDLGGDADAMINSMAGDSNRLVGRISLSANFFEALEDLGDIETPDPPRRLTRDPYRVNSTRATRSIPIPEIPVGASPSAPASPVSGTDLRVQVESSPSAAPIASTSTAAADVDQFHHGRSRTRLSEAIRRQMPDQDQIEIQRNRHRFALLRRVRQREYHRVIGSGSTHA